MIPQFSSIAAILSSTLIFLVGNGLLGTLIPVRAHLEGFSTLAIGVIGSAYFAGFVIGCFTGPRWLNRVGHIRTFMVCAGIAAAATLMQSILISVTAWVAMRALFGFAAANMYMVLESWLNDRAGNETRGRIFAAYLSVNFGGLLVGQLLFATSRPGSFTLFSLTTIFYALCMIPVGLTRLPQPVPAPVPVLRPLRLFRISPVGVAGCIAVGLANNAIWTMAPVYAQSRGLSNGMIALFMAAFTIGGTLLQVPVGRLSDRMDRRYVIAGICALAAVVGIVIAVFGGHGHGLILWLMALYGTLMLQLYGLSVAHANDRIPRQQFVEASATLLLINSLASIVGPTLAAGLMDAFGVVALFFFTAAVHITMTVFTVVRLRQKEGPGEVFRERFEPVPHQASPTALELDPRGPEEEKVA
ncbi:MAG: MFS transporter [Alphaproteobacteria bacterium]|nr:MFS transporter [Alphaproteobacteria bacterium]MDE1987190.1 MFS transporter [Alphaproteobacteria bacterium]MDE2163637.1 MFS transporter [Alphaproteobacteria bacterium]MDE2265546.1 MFS transporter [Alphaproteobacteria bacterium]MDE2500461.1 MFS transporter [Alphaproteobacteria bacterium]